MYRPPILGFDDWAANPSVHAQWADDTPVATVGILGDMSPETLAREQAERECKEGLRQQSNVILLEDWRQND
jgi:hypothetical protein